MTRALARPQARPCERCQAPTVLDLHGHACCVPCAHGWAAHLRHLPLDPAETRAGRGGQRANLDLWHRRFAAFVAQERNKND